MKCFSCGKGPMKIQTASVEAVVRGEKYMVEVEAEVCNQCGEALFDDAQADAYTIAGSDAYRRAHGLLTTAEIKAARNRLGLTQQQLAERLKVGIASVKRWELGAIQDESSDRLIRLCTDSGAARQNLREIEALEDPQSSAGPVLIEMRPLKASEWQDAPTNSSLGDTNPRPRESKPRMTPTQEETHAA